MIFSFLENQVTPRGIRPGVSKFYPNKISRPEVSPDFLVPRKSDDTSVKFNKNYLLRMKHTFTLLTLSFFIINSAAAQFNAACDGTRFKGPVFTQVKKTTVDYAPAPNFAELAQTGDDSVILKMDVYEPMGDVAVARPVVILAHGGSFMFGNKTDMKADCERFAKAGYVAVSIQYRLYPLLVLGFPDSTDIVGTVVKSVSSMKAAVRYFRQDAATVNLFKADTAHIFIGGYSAGSVCALHTAYLSENDPITPYVQNALDLNGGFAGDAGTAENRTYSDRISGIYNRSGGLYNNLWINEGDAPMVSIHGTADDVVFYESGLAAGIAYLEGTGVLHPRALEVGVSSYLETVIGGDHSSMYGATSPFAPQYANFQVKAFEKFESITCGTALDATEAVAAVPLKIFPNPAAEMFHLDAGAHTTGAQVRIIDMQGRLVRVVNYLPGNAIWVQDLVRGVYSVQVIWEDGDVQVGQLLK